MSWEFRFRIVIKPNLSSFKAELFTSKLCSSKGTVMIITDIDLFYLFSDNSAKDVFDWFGSNLDESDVENLVVHHSTWIIVVLKVVHVHADSTNINEEDVPF